MGGAIPTSYLLPTAPCVFHANPHNRFTDRVDCMRGGGRRAVAAHRTTLKHCVVARFSRAGLAISVILNTLRPVPWVRLPSPARVAEAAIRASGSRTPDGPLGVACSPTRFAVGRRSGVACLYQWKADLRVSVKSARSSRPRRVLIAVVALSRGPGGSRRQRRSVPEPEYSPTHCSLPIGSAM